MGQPYYPKYAMAAAAAVDGTSDPVVVVGHSAAGALLPAIAEAVGDRTRGAVFVDAMLPQPGRSWFDTAPPGTGGAATRPRRSRPAAAVARMVPSGLTRGIGARPGAEATSHRRDSATAGGLLRRARAARTIRESVACAFLRLGAPFDRAADKAATARLVGGPQGLGSPADAQRPGGGRRPYRAGDFRDPIRVMAFWACGTCL